MPRTVRDHALARVAAARAEIARIKSPDFPAAPRQGLDRIDAIFLDLHKTLTEDVDQDNQPEAIKAVAEDTLDALDRYLPLIGFMLRATNVRNAFELSGPLLRMAQQVLGAETHIVLSSEWEFSPFTYRSIVGLPNFVLIGLPASESGNGLIAPLAGHELGHAVYERRNIRSIIETPVAEALVQGIEARWDEYHAIFEKLAKAELRSPEGVRTWEPIFDLAVDQSEESFCDVVGLRLFGESYLHAFAYLLAPCLKLRSASYPSMIVRVTNLLAAAKAFGIPIPDGYLAEFRDSREDHFSSSDKLICSFADGAAAAVVPLLIEQVTLLAAECSLRDRDEGEIANAVQEMRKVIPARTAPDLATIANAGWACYHDSTLWDDYDHIVERRQEVLNDLVLKSAEILEIRQRLAEVAVAAEF